MMDTFVHKHKTSIYYHRRYHAAEDDPIVEVISSVIKDY